MDWIYDDGGRSRYFKAENVGDCVCRAIAIATQKDYKEVYNDLGELHKKRYGTKTARNGANREDIRKLMERYGWIWRPTMGIGTGCRVHLEKDELPSGRIVCSLSRHLVAVVDGVVHDTYDSTRDGKRCVYGYWYKPSSRNASEKVAKVTKKDFMEKVDAFEADLLGGLITPKEFGWLCEKAAREWRGK